MQGYVVRKGNQHYAVIYEGLDPISGRERRRWHPAGPDRSEAEALVRRLAADRMADRSPRRSSLTVGVYLTQRWLPANQARLRPSTWAGYDANVRLHIVPRIGRVPLRHLRPDHVERMYSDLSVEGNHVRHGGLDAKTVLEIHQVLRRSLDDAVRRGMIVSNPAAVAHAPRRRPLGSSVAKGGPPSSYGSSSITPPITASARPCGCQPTPASDAASSPDSTGAMSTSMNADSRSTGLSCRSATNSSSHAARPGPLGAASTSTPPPCRCCATGATDAPPSSRTV